MQSSPLPSIPRATSRTAQVVVTGSERRWEWIFITFVLLITSLPYFLAYHNQGEAFRFTGHVFGVEDGNSYLAKMLSGSYGAWLFHTPYTAYPQNGTLIYIPYILLGKLAAPPALHDQLVVLFHVFRLVAGALMILATYDFIAFFVHEVRLRRIGLVLAILGGGLGWLFVIAGHQTWLGSLPLEYYSPESFGFLGLYGVPHLALARALLLWGVLVYLRVVARLTGPHGSQYNWLPQAARAGVLWLLAGLTQPLTTMLVGLVVILHILVLGLVQMVHWLREKPVAFNAWLRVALTAFVAGLIPAPLVFYNMLVFNIDPILRNWTTQNLITSPNPLHYLLAYGVILPFAVLGGVRLVRRSPWTGWLLAVWALALPVLAYAPFNLQRRLVEGGWIVLVTLAVCAWAHEWQGADQKARRKQTLLAAGVTALLLPSTLFLILGGLFAASQPAQPLFRPADEVAVFEFLQSNAGDGSVVLTSFDTGNALPAWAPVHVLVGHGPEGAYESEVRPLAEAFYRSDTQDAQRRDLLRRFNVRYVFWGPAERQLGEWMPNQADYLHPVFGSGDYVLFEVDPSRLK
jgi:hypothetical protein